MLVQITTVISEAELWYCHDCFPAVPAADQWCALICLSPRHVRRWRCPWPSSLDPNYSWRGLGIYSPADCNRYAETYLSKDWHKTQTALAAKPQPDNQNRRSRLGVVSGPEHVG